MKKYTITKKDGFVLYENENGKKVSVSSVGIIEEDGYAFRNLVGGTKLLPYEDWRLSDEERAEDLAGRLSIEDIAGLMMYSPHQMVPQIPGEPFPMTYGGKTFPESGYEEWQLSDQQKNLLMKNRIRHFLVMKLSSSDTAARWNNELQKLCERMFFGIPVNISSDPRHGSGMGDSEYKTQASNISQWPEMMGLAATFSPELVKRYGEVVAEEYRALGITTALSPQVDLGTEPRWMRFEDTFGQSVELVTALGRAYCDGLQTTPGSKNGWGDKSVSAMVKHWPGGGPCESGRDAHYPYGKYAVYPGNRLKEHIAPFVTGAFQLNGPTKCAAAVMPYYTVSWNIDQKNHENVGNSYSKYIITDILREKYGFNGVVCTDWMITGDPAREMDGFGSRCYGVESLSVAERHLRAIEAGVDQFGGNSDAAPILKAFCLGCEKYGEDAMKQRFRKSATRLLLNFFRCGLFDNPYLDPQESKRIVGCTQYREEGYEAQLKSLVLLKNKDVLPVENLKKKKVFIPDRHIRPRKDFFRETIPEITIPGVSKAVIEEYTEVVEDPQNADLAIVFMESPLTVGGYSKEQRKATGNGYQPISLQYRPYQADTARKISIAGGDFREESVNRSYRGKTCITANENDLDNVIWARERMGKKPVIVVIRMKNPTVMAEVEPYADAIVVDFGVEKRAVMDILSGKHPVTGRLPFRLPANMETVEAHAEDTAFDYDAYVDSQGNVYDFGFGLSYNL